jgi:hypothetical protein
MPETALIDLLIPSLRINKTLTNFDLRDNPGFSKKVRKLTALCLLRNIDLLKKKYLPPYAIGKTWLNPDCLLPKTHSMGTIFDLDDEEPGQENKGVNRKRPQSNIRSGSKSPLSRNKSIKTN